MATLWCTNQTFGTLCFSLLHCLPAIKRLLTLVSSHVTLRERGHFLEKITGGIISMIYNELDREFFLRLSMKSANEGKQL